MVNNNSNQVAPKQQQQQLSAREQSQNVGRVEEHEYEANAKAQAALNLNIFAAFSGIFSGKKKKTTTTDAKGNSHSVEHSTGRGHVDGAGYGTLQAVGQGETNTHERLRVREAAGAQDRKAVQAVDHLGIEAPPADGGKK